MKKDLPLEDSEKRHLRTETIRYYKAWKICSDKKRREFLAKQFNKIAAMYIERTRCE